MLSLPELMVLGLASARGTQFIVHDTITEPLRDRLELWHARNHDGYWRNFWRDLFSCLYCTGAHLAWIAVLTYLLATGCWSDAPVLVHGIEWMAVAGIQMSVNQALYTLRNR